MCLVPKGTTFSGYICQKNGLMQGLNLFGGLKKTFCNEIPCTSYKSLATTELLSSSGNVKAGQNLPEAREGHGMLVINKKLIIIGGETNSWTNSVLVYNTEDLTRYVSRVVEYHKNFFSITCSSHDFTNLFHNIFLCFKQLLFTFTVHKNKETKSFSLKKSGRFVDSWNYLMSRSQYFDNIFRELQKYAKI